MRERKRSASQEFMEARRARRLQAAERRCAQEAWESAVSAALARRRPGPQEIVARCLGGQREPSRRLHELLSVIAEKAPRLISEERLRAFERMAAVAWFRAPADWKPDGKGSDRLFRSLAAHLFARYPMPSFLWSAFLAGENRA